MAQPSPVTERVARILEYLGAHPNESFTASEIARELGMNRASCSAVLTSLLDHGYVMQRRSGKTYALGPSLIRLAEAAAPRIGPAVAAARSEMNRVVADLDVRCTACGVVGDRLVTFAARSPNPAGSALDGIGNGYPFRAPFGLALAAWLDAERQREWLKAVGPDLTPAATEALSRAFEAVQEQGYVVVLESDVSPGPDGMANDEVAPVLRRFGRQDLVVRADDPAHYRVDHISAAVQDEAGIPVIELSLDLLPGPLTADEIGAYALRLTKAARYVEDAYHAQAGP